MLTIVMSPKLSDGTLSSLYLCLSLSYYVEPVLESKQIKHYQQMQWLKHTLRNLAICIYICSLGYQFDGTKYVESSAVMDFYTQSVILTIVVHAVDFDLVLFNKSWTERKTNFTIQSRFNLWQFGLW